MFDSPLFSLDEKGQLIRATICCPSFIIVFIIAYLIAKELKKKL